MQAADGAKQTAAGNLLEFDPHWFRRAVHAFGASFVVYYLLPDAVPWVAWFKRYGPLILFAIAAAVEAYRMAGGIRSEHFFGLREYERRRVSGYIYFAAAALMLLYLFPQSIAIPCLVGAAIGDPIMGELRRGGRPRAGLAAGAAFGAALFAIAGWGAGLALLGGALMALGESTKIRWLDDDLLMPMLPALGLLALTLTGAAAAPPDLIPAAWQLGGAP